MIALKKKLNSWLIKLEDKGSVEFFNKILLTQVFCLISVIFLAIFGINAIFYKKWFLSGVLISSSIIFLLIIIYLNKTKKYITSKYLSVGLLSLVFLFLLTTGGINETGILWSLIYPAFSLLILGLQKGSIFSGIYLFIAIIIIFLPESVIHNISYDLPLKIRFISGFIVIYLFLLVYEYIRVINFRKLEKIMLSTKNENKEKNQFISKLSHQIRIPLSNIIVLGNLLSKSKFDDKTKDLVDTILASSNNLVQLVNNIVKVMSMEVSETEKATSFDLHSTINDTIQLFSDQQSDNIHFDLSVSDIKNNLIGNLLRIKQIFLNLIENLLININDKKINIDIKVTPQKETKKEVELLFEIKNNRPIFLPLEISQNYFVTISNYPKEPNTPTYINLFDLSIAKKLIEESGGKLSISSTANHSVFSFKLPFKKIQLEPVDDLLRKIPIAPPTLEPRKKIDLKDSNILLVEDNLINQKIVIISLIKEVKNIDVANDGKEALDKFGTTKYDLILMDIQMPIMDGYITTKKIREIEASTNTYTPIIAITASALVGDKENCLAAGMDEYISKPFQVEVLLGKMKKLLS